MQDTHGGHFSWNPIWRMKVMCLNFDFLTRPLDSNASNAGSSDSIGFDSFCCLLLLLLALVVGDVEELELVDALRGANDSEPVAELHLLEELLGAK